MPNFTNFTKLQIIVERTPGGADQALGGNYDVTITVTGTPTADGNITILGNTIAVLSADTTEQVTTKINTALSGLTDVTVTVINTTSLLISYGASATIPTVPTSEMTNGVTGTYSITDNRDGTPFILKHSEYEDSESGLKVATEAMYSLVAASAETDSIQLQRIKLSDSDTELVTDNITLKVIGKNYSPYTI